MKHLSGDILTPTDGAQNIVIFNPLNTTGEPQTGLQLQIRDELPNVHSSYVGWCNRVRQNNDKFEAGCVSMKFLKETHGYNIANCCVFNVQPNVDFAISDVRKALFDLTTAKYPDCIIRVPYKLGRQEWEMSDVYWDEIMEMMRVCFPRTKFEIWHHEPHKTPRPIDD